MPQTDAVCKNNSVYVNYLSRNHFTLSLLYFVCKKLGVGLLMVTI